MKNYDISVVVERCFIPPVNGGKMDYWFESFAVNDKTTIGEIVEHLRKLEYIEPHNHPFRKLGQINLVATESLLEMQEKEGV